MTPARSGADSPAQSAAQSVSHGEPRIQGLQGCEAAGQGRSAPARGAGRLLKGASPLQFRPRPSADELRYSLARRLTTRDRDIVHAVAHLGVLTAPQIAEAFFESEDRARKRLLTLVRVGALARFRPHREGWGLYPYHYVLSPGGAGIVAAERGEDPARTRKRLLASRVIALSRTQRLEHIVGVNGVWAALAGRARSEAAAEVRLWLTEAECARWAKGIVRPDAYFEWSTEDGSVECFVEFDRGTETLGRLRAKLDGYERFERERGETAWVLFAFTSPRREANARAALADATVPVATASLAGGTGAGAAGWLPLRAHERMRIEGLGCAAKPAEAEARAAEGRGRGWRFDRSRFDDQEEAPIETS